MEDIVICGKRGNVAKSTLLDQLDRFATLATRLAYINVSPFPLESHACHACHTEIENEVENISTNRPVPKIKSCMKWLSIVIEEGHLEPSQPLVGRATGWPQRTISIKSPWVDFFCWCYKQKIPKNEIPDQMEFFKLLDQLFIRSGDKYQLPSLEHCRVTFATLRLQYECD